MKRFLCDEMVVRLGRWLRAAGYDTAIADAGSDDRKLLDDAIREGRILLTSDRKMMERRLAEGNVFLFSGNELESWVAEITPAFDIDWLHAPFSRCLLCNADLISGAGDQAHTMPAYVLAESIPCFHCKACGKVFWEGGHVLRMRRKLQAWQLRYGN